MSTEETKTETSGVAPAAEPALAEQKINVGALFKETREAMHMSVGDVAQHLKLSSAQVEALEADEHDKLPGAVFVRGFIRNYARLLGIDATPLLAPVETRKAAVPSLTETVPVSQDIPFPEKAGIPWHIYGIVIAVLAIPVLIFQFFYRDKPVDDVTTLQTHAVTLPTPQVVGEENQAASAPVAAETPTAMPAPVEAEKPVAEKPALEKKAEMPAATTQTWQAAPQAAKQEAAKTTTGVVDAVIGKNDAQTDSAQSQSDDAADNKSLDAAMSEQMLKHLKTVTVEPTDGTHALALTFDEDAWVEVYDARGQSIFWQLGKAGTTRHVSGIAPLVLVIGNAHSVHVSVDSKPLDITPYVRTDVARFKLQ